MGTAEILQQALDDIVARLGDDVTYTFADETQAVIRGGLQYEEAPHSGPRSASARAVLEVKKADVPYPAYRDKAEVDGVEWTVLGIKSGDGLTWTLNLVRDERPAWPRP